jgi:hypothetical protein
LSCEIAHDVVAESVAKRPDELRRPRLFIRPFGANRNYRVGTAALWKQAIRHCRVSCPAAALVDLLVQQTGVGELRLLRPVLVALAPRPVALLQTSRMPNAGL